LTILGSFFLVVVEGGRVKYERDQLAMSTFTIFMTTVNNPIYSSNSERKRTERGDLFPRVPWDKKFDPKCNTIPFTN